LQRPLGEPQPGFLKDESLRGKLAQSSSITKPRKIQRRIISVSFSENRTKSKFFLLWPPTAASFPNAYQFSPQEDHFEKTASNSSASRSSNQHYVSYSRMGRWSPTLAQAVDLCAF